MFPPDFKELLSVFNSRKVRYLLIGGYAVSLHAQPRATKDLDLLVNPDAGNLKALYAALAEFGTPLEGLKERDLMEPGMFFRMGVPPLMVDILPAIEGVDFEGAWERRVDMEIDPGSGLRVPVIARTDLIAAKLAAARPQDLVDAAALRETEVRQTDKRIETSAEENQKLRDRSR
jgi:Nucleotidyl transferase AbiEii toxin, Type IV TA system